MEKKLKTEDRPSILECLGDLASFDRPTRMAAAESLIIQLAEKQGSSDEICEDLNLTIDRITFGLASGREGSRQGFSIVLTELLRLFPNIRVDKVLKIVMVKMDPTGEKGDSEKQYYFGRIFAINCLVQSGRLKSLNVGRESVLKQCFDILVSSEKKSYMKELVANSLIELLGEVRDVKELRSIGVPFMKDLLAVAPDDATPEGLALILAIVKQFGAEKALGDGVIHEDWTLSSNFLGKNLKLIKTALLSSSYTHPRMHFVWGMILERVFEGKMQREFWGQIDTLMLGSHVDNRKYLGFCLLIQFLERSSSAEDIVHYLNAPNTKRSLTNHSGDNKVTKMHDVATRVTDTVKSKVADGNSELGLLLIQARYLNSIHLDLQLLPLLDSDAGLKYVKSLLKGFNKEHGDWIVSALKRGWKKWVHGVDEKEKAKLVKLTFSCVKKFGQMAFFAEEEADKQWAKMRLTTVLTELEGTGHANMIQFCQWLANEPGADELLDKKGRKLLKKSARCLSTSGSGPTRYERAFEKVIGLVAFMNLTEQDDESFLDLWEDIVTAQSEFAANIEGNGKKESSARNKAVLVFVSVLIELLTVASALNRSVVVGSFRLIAPMIPERGIRDIVMAILATDNEEGDDEEEEGEEDGEDEEFDEEEDDDEILEKDSNDNSSSSEGDEDALADIALDEADPEYLKRVEESLANVFRAMKEEKGGSKEKKKKDSVALDFKLRVVDLVDQFVHSLTRMASMESLPLASKEQGDNRAVLFILLPEILAKLKKTQYSKKLKPLHDKLSRVLLKSLCEMREWPSMAKHGRALRKALGKILRYVSSGNPTHFMVSTVEKCAVVLVKVLSKENMLRPEAARDDFMKVAVYCGTKKNLKHLDFERFFVPLFARVPEIGALILPEVEKECVKASWLARGRASCVNTFLTYFTQSGKAYFLNKGHEKIKPSFASLERVFLSWLIREEASNAANIKASVTTLSRFYDVLVNFMCNPKLGGCTKRNVFDAVSLRSEIESALKKMTKKNPKKLKLQELTKKILKLISKE